MLGQQLELELVLEQVLEQLLEPRWHHRNQERQWQVSSWRCERTGQYRFSKRRRKHYASCLRIERRLQLRELRRQSTSPHC